MDLNIIKANGILLFPKLSRLLLVSVPHLPSFTDRILDVLATLNINLQFIAETVLPDGSHQLVICVDDHQLKMAVDSLSFLCDEGLVVLFDVLSDTTVLAIYGPHFREKPGPAFLAYHAFYRVNVPILAISSSFSAVAYLVEGRLATQAVEALREAYELPEEAVFVSSQGCSRPA